MPRAAKTAHAPTPPTPQDTLDVYEFGQCLLETLDLDPVYVLLHRSGFDRRTMEHWLLAYWCFYHVGTASWVTDGGHWAGQESSNFVGNYWKAMGHAAGTSKLPRSTERRHFRGRAAAASVLFLAQAGINNLFGPLSDDRVYTAKEVTDYVRTWVGFGPWIAFKVADMLERLGLCRVDFDVATAMYESPLKGARLMWESEGRPSGGKGAGLGHWAVTRLLSRLGEITAPPGHDRLVNVQEMETILCKHASYRAGHYKLGEDVAHCRKGLLRFAKSRTSQLLLKSGREGGLWP